VTGVEVNVSCPNIKEGSCMFGSNLDMFKRVIAAVRQKTKLSLISKLAPDIAGIKTFAKAAEESGADAISLINSVPAMAIDIEERRPKLGNVTGGLSGPAIKPIAVKMVWEAARAVNIPIVGIGGVSSAADALEFMIAGATAVAVGTANFMEPATAVAVIEGVEAYLVRHGMKSIVELVGSLRK
jgi:dihydroorotate dehydrogenase (NAD+) catalytic subunit